MIDKNEYFCKKCNQYEENDFNFNTRCTHDELCNAT